MLDGYSIYFLFFSHLLLLMFIKVSALIAGAAFFVFAGFAARVFFGRFLTTIPDARARAVFYPVLGAGIFILVLMLQGISGFFSPVQVRLSFGLFIIAGAIAALTNRDWIAEIKVLRPFSGPRVLWAGLTVCFILALAGVWSPETDNDSLCYHMHLAKLYLQHGKIWFHPYEWNATFPFNMELLYACGLAVNGIYLAKIFHLGLAALTAAGIFIFLRQKAGSFAAQCAACLYFSAPAVLNGAVSTYIDAGLASFTFFAFWVLFEGGKSKSLPLFFTAGLLMGISMGIKFLAAITGAGLLVLTVFALGRGFLKYAAVFGGVSFLTGIFWYARSWILRGNPVFPYFYSVFGRGDGTINYEDVGVAKTLLNLLAIPWTLSMRPDLFEGYSVQYGIYFLIFSPLALLTARQSWVRCALFMFYFYLTCWFFLGQSLRFLLPALPLWALLAASGQSEAAKKVSARAVATVAFFLFAVNILFVGYYFRGQVGTAFGLVPEKEFLKQTQRSYPMADFINKNLPAESKVYSSDESHLFYYDREVVRESSYLKVNSLKARDYSLQKWISNLRAGGYTHILTVESGENLVVQVDGCRSLSCLIRRERLPVAEYLKPLYNYDFNYTDQGVFHYYLYEIL